jgi:hypothetical protein
LGEKVKKDTAEITELREELRTAAKGRSVHPPREKIPLPPRPAIPIPDPRLTTSSSTESVSPPVNPVEEPKKPRQGAQRKEGEVSK